MNDWCFRLRFCTVKAKLGWRQPGRMRLTSIIKSCTVLHYSHGLSLINPSTNGNIKVLLYVLHYQREKSVLIPSSHTAITMSQLCTHTETSVQMNSYHWIAFRQEWMNEWCFRPHCSAVRLYWGKDNLGMCLMKWILLWITPQMQFEWLTYWSAVQCATTMLRLTHFSGGNLGLDHNWPWVKSVH